MAKCMLCKKETDELYSAILDREVMRICEECAKMEGVPIMKKPTQNQLDRANQRYTVRERMMKISGLASLNAMSKDHEIAQRHLAKIRIPERKQESSSLISNYDWVIKMARRRRKLSLAQVAESSGVSVQVLEAIEKGILPKEVEKTMISLEKTLGVQLLKNHETRIRFIMPEKKQTETDILNKVQDRMTGKEIKDNDEDLTFKYEESAGDLAEQEDINEIMRQEKEKAIQRENPYYVQQKNETKQAVEEMQKGELKFTDKTKLKNVTLNDIIDAKRAREKRQKEMMGK